MVSRHDSLIDPYSLRESLKWVIVIRVVFCVVLIGGTLIFSIQENLSIRSLPFMTLYYLAAGFLILSVGFGIWLKSGRQAGLLAWAQILADICGVTVIIFVTGKFDSMFTFLYLIVIIYASMLLHLRGVLTTAAISCIQYGVLINLEYYRMIPSWPGLHPMSSLMEPSHVMYRILLVMSACFGVAFLSGFLSLQLKQARQELKVTQAHLKRVEKMQTVDEMISGIIHEINNPLASLAGSIQLLREDTPPGTYGDRLMAIILRETGRLRRIVDDIRLFARPGRANARPVNLVLAISDVISLFRNTPAWKDRIQVITYMDARLFVCIDPVHLDQILWNLMKNAADAIPEKGKIIITVNSPRINRIHLTLRDTGTGMNPDTARHIFDPFFTTKPDGTGMGLSIIHRLIDTYDGMMDFDSIPGKGTLFTIIFKTDHSCDTTKS